MVRGQLRGDGSPSVRVSSFSARCSSARATALSHRPSRPRIRQRPPLATAAPFRLPRKRCLTRATRGSSRSEPRSPMLVADDFAVPTRTIWTITEMKLVLGTIFTTPPTIAVRSDNDGAPGPVIANPTVTILGHEMPPGQIATRVHVALASPLTLDAGRYWLSVEMGTHNPSWFMTVGPSPYVHWSFDAGQTWAQAQSGGDVGFTLFGTAATAETKTSGPPEHPWHARTRRRYPEQPAGQAPCGTRIDRVGG